MVPGWIRYRLGVEQGPENGIMLPPDTMVVGDFSGHHLELSDLILGARSAHLTWRRADQDTVWFNRHSSASSRFSSCSARDARRSKKRVHSSSAVPV